jgi:hypothetical protein
MARPRFTINHIHLSCWELRAVNQSVDDELGDDLLFLRPSSAHLTLFFELIGYLSELLILIGGAAAKPLKLRAPLQLSPAAQAALLQELKLRLVDLGGHSGSVREDTIRGVQIRWRSGLGIIDNVVDQSAVGRSGGLNFGEV